VTGEERAGQDPGQERRAPVNPWAITVAVAAALAFLYVVRLAVLPYLVAAAIAYVVHPAIGQVERRLGIRRSVAAVLVYLGVVALLAAIVYWVLVSLTHQIAAALGDLPRLLHKFLAELFGAEHITIFGRNIDAAHAAEQATDAVVAVVGAPEDWLDFAVAGFALITALTLVLVLIFYFLADGRRLAQGALWLVPPEYRAEVAEVAAKIDPMLRRYLGGLFVIVVFATALSYLAIAFMLQLPFALLLSLLTGLLELIPVIGPMVSASLVGLIALEQHGLWAVAAFAAYVTVFRLAIDRLIGPLVLGHAAQLHPTVVMFAFLAGGLFLGVAGVILAVPVAASVRIILEHYYSHPMRGRAH
jgi:predicted PurR-regulated permease PerM